MKAELGNGESLRNIIRDDVCFSYGDDMSRPNVYEVSTRHLFRGLGCVHIGSGIFTSACVIHCRVGHLLVQVGKFMSFHILSSVMEINCWFIVIVSRNRAPINEPGLETFSYRKHCEKILRPSRRGILHAQAMYIVCLITRGSKLVNHIELHIGSGYKVVSL